MIIEYIALLFTFYVGLLLWNQYRPKTKKRYFSKMVRDLELQLWDKEFERFKTKEAREELRSEYDRKKANLATLEMQMKMNDESDKKMPDGDRKRMDDQKDLMVRDIKRMEQGREEGDPGQYVFNLKDFDTAIEKINYEMEQLRSMQGLASEYIKKEI